MSTPASGPTEQRSFGSRMGSAAGTFLRALVRLLLIIIVAALIGAAVYFGVPRLYAQYVQPVQENTAAIRDLQARQSQDVDSVNQRISSIQERLDSLEVQSDQDKQTIAGLQAELAGLGDALASQEALLSDGVARLDDLDQALAGAEGALDQLDRALVAFQSEITESVEGNQAEIAALAETFSDAANPLNSLRRELKLVRVMELILRSRLFLSQNNLGLVAEDVQAARDLLDDLQPQVFDYQAETIQTVIDRLDLVLGNLPDDLDQVSRDLDTAWELLAIGLPEEAPADLEAGTPESPVGTPEATPDMTGTPEVTPTPTS